MTKRRVSHKPFRITCYLCNGLGYRQYDGDRLRALRAHAGLSLREVARRLKLSAAYICDIELNRRGSTKRIMDYYLSLKGEQ